MQTLKKDLLNNLTSISIPRAIGSQGNEKSANKITSYCKKYVNHKKIIFDIFGFSDKAEKKSIIFFAIVSILVLVGVLYGLASQQRPFVLIFSILWSLFIILFFNYWLEIFNFFGKFGKIPCKTIIVKMGNPLGSNGLLLTAHRDSLSSNPSGTVYFNRLYALLFRIPLIISGILILSAVVPFQNSLLSTGLKIIVLLYASVLSWFSFGVSFGNNSPGAYDNGTGVALLMQLIKKYSNKKLPLQLWIAFLDAEEAGYGGSLNLAKSLPKNFKIINFDGIGSENLELIVADGPLKKKTSSSLNKEILSTCKSLKLDMHEYWSVLYPGSDHVPFVKSGFEATTITSDSFNIHSPEDTIDKVDFNQMVDVINIVDNLIKKLSKN